MPIILNFHHQVTPGSQIRKHNIIFFYSHSFYHILIDLQLPSKITILNGLFSLIIILTPYLKMTVSLNIHFHNAQESMFGICSLSLYCTSVPHTYCYVKTVAYRITLPLLLFYYCYSLSLECSYCGARKTFNLENICFKQYRDIYLCFYLFIYFPKISTLVNNYIQALFSLSGCQQ